MCTRPILIRNKKLLQLDVEVPNSFLHVPCGSCDECLRKRAKDLFVRASFESRRCYLHGGNGFMCTLTYDNNNVPIFEHLGKKYMVFNKLDVIKFFKRLRVRLDRFYNREFNSDAPVFKYLVTSEFGTNPYATHRPHYHLLIFFEKSVPYFYFRKCFEESLKNQKTGKSYFGMIFQCDPLDLSQGGVKYSCKYILKDQAYSVQRNIILDYIKFKQHYVNSKYGVNEFPKTADDFFFNRAIRSRKDYRKDIESFVRPYSHMLQFYMCSNDFGCSAICEHYGESLFTLGVLNIDKFPYSIPKAVVQRLERTSGSDKRDIVAKAVFQSQFQNCVNDVVSRGIISSYEGEELNFFAARFIQPRYGCLYFSSPSFYDSSGLQNFDTLYESYLHYDDNYFFTLRNKVIDVINLSNCKTNLEFRAALAHRKTEEDRERYLRKKFNQS